MVRFAFDYPADALKELCRRHHVGRLSVFGSALRDDFGPDSDVDVLIEFDRNYPVGFRVFRVREELSQLFSGRAVILSSAKVLYEEG